jgi:hypothetical protein
MLKGVDDVRQLGEDQPGRPQGLAAAREDHRPPGIGDAPGVPAKGGGDPPAEFALYLLCLGADGGHRRPLTGPHLVGQHDLLP